MLVMFAAGSGSLLWMLLLTGVMVAEKTTSRGAGRPGRHRYPDPDTFLRVCVELDLPDWRHDRYRTLLERAARTTDPVGRLATYEEAERILAEEAIIVPLFYEPEHLLLKPWVSSHPSIPVKYPGFWQDTVIGPR